MTEAIEEYGATLVECIVAMAVLRLFVAMFTSPDIGGFKTFFEIFVKSLVG